MATPEEKLAKAPKNLCLPSEELVHVVVNVPFVWSVKVLVNVMGPITTPSSLTVSTPVLLDGVHRAARLNGPSPVLKPEDGHFPPLIFEQRMDPLQFNPKMLWGRCCRSRDLSGAEQAAEGERGYESQFT